MREKLNRALKIILMIFGVIFLIQILLFIIVTFSVFGFHSLKTPDFNVNTDKITSITKPKEIQSVINYIEEYKLENKKYPDEIDKKVDLKGYKYELSEDRNCYTLTFKKDAQIKKYQHCSNLSNNFSSASDSYVEYIK